MSTVEPCARPRGIPLAAILAGMVAIQAIVVWVFAGLLFPGLV